MGYIGARRILLTEVIKKYAKAQCYVINETSSEIDKELLELYNEVEGWFLECGLYNDENYPDLNIRDLLPEEVMDSYNRFLNRELE